MLRDAPLVLFSRATGLPFREIANAPLVLLDWKCRQAGVGLGCAEPQAAPMPASSSRRAAGTLEWIDQTHHRLQESVRFEALNKLLDSSSGSPSTLTALHAANSLVDTHTRYITLTSGLQADLLSWYRDIRHNVRRRCFPMINHAQWSI